MTCCAEQPRLVLDNSVAFELFLTNPMQTPTEVNDATVVANIYDPEGNLVSGQVWPVSMPQVIGQDGLYRETIPSISGLVAGFIYSVEYLVTGPGGLSAKFCIKVKAQEC